MDDALRDSQAIERADLVEALQQERERGDALETENGEMLDTLRVVSRALDAVGVVLMKHARTRVLDNWKAEWNGSLSRARAELLEQVMRVTEPEPEVKKRARTKPLPANT